MLKIKQPTRVKLADQQNHAKIGIGSIKVKKTACIAQRFMWEKWVLIHEALAPVVGTETAVPLDRLYLNM